MKLGAIVLDSDDVEELSDFYAKLLGWIKSSQINNGEKWITVMKEDHSETPLVFQETPDFVRPKWPSNRKDQQQMVHLDFYVKKGEFEDRIKYAVDCGAKMAEIQFSDEWMVMIDPSGHPFCIIPIPDDIYGQRYE